MATTTSGYGDEDDEPPPKPPRPWTWWAAGAGVVAIGIAAIAWSSGAGGFRFQAIFGDAKGLLVGDGVYYRGAQAGDVAETHFEGEAFVATLALRPEIAEGLREDLLIYIERDKLRDGRMRVSLVVLDPLSARLKDGSTIRGEDSVVG